MVKSWMKNASGLKLQQLDIQQQALKLTANRYFHLIVIFILLLLHLSRELTIFFIVHLHDPMMVMQYVWMPRVF